MLPTAARLLRLLTLLSSRRAWAGADLAARLEITDRTLRRDVERLRSLGYPVRSAAGNAGGYQLAAGTELPPLLLDDDEAIAVSLGLCTTAGAGLTEASVRALAKIDQVLPARLRRRVRALHASIVPLEGLGRQADPEVLCAVAGACRDRERLGFVYRDRTGAISTRRTEPCGLVHTGRRFYLVAWDLDREAFRTFRLDRVERLGAVGPGFTPREPPDADLAAYVSRSISTEAHAATAKVILHAPVEAMADHISPSTGVLERLDATRCRLTVGGRSPTTLCAWLGMLGVDFEVEEPAALREHLATLAGRFQRAAAS